MLMERKPNSLQPKKAPEVGDSAADERQQEATDRWDAIVQQAQAGELDVNHPLDTWWVGENTSNSSSRPRRLMRSLRGGAPRAGIEVGDKEGLLKRYIPLVLATLKGHSRDPHQAKEDLKELRRNFQKSLTGDPKE